MGNNLPKKIKRARKAKRITLEQLAKAITGEQLLLATAPLNDDCRDPFLMTEESVPFLPDSWYLYVAGCKWSIG